MGFEWDEEKNKSNLNKHGIDFETSSDIWSGFVAEQEDFRQSWEEERLIALGMVSGRVLVVVYTWRGPNRRIISARKADKSERKIYEKFLVECSFREGD